MAIFLATLVVKLFSGVLAVFIDWTSGSLGRCSHSRALLVSLEVVWSRFN
jgi:hypothetical protein